MSDDDLMTAAAAYPPEQPESSSKEDRAHARRNSILRAVLVGAYLYVVFGILLPRIVDYGAVLDAFRAAPPEWLAVVFVVGIAAWFTEGMALNAVLPELGIIRGTVTFLSMAAVGSTVPGPIKMAFGFRLFRGWGISIDRAALGLTLTGLATQASKLILPALAVLLLTVSGTIPTWGFLLAVAIALPVALGVMVGVWIMRSEAFARRVGAFATRATDAVARPPSPGEAASGSFSMGKPSTTYSGSLFPVMEAVPRTRMEMPPPGVALAEVTCTPAAAPCSTWSSEATGVVRIASVFTELTAPVTSRRRSVP